MSLGTAIVLFLVLAAAGLAIWVLHRDKKNGKSCSCGGCSGCCTGCAHSVLPKQPEGEKR